jgi:twinkle protein
MKPKKLGTHIDPMRLYNAALAQYVGGGLKPGSSTGWPNLDTRYTVAPGQWTLVTGLPGSGKSEWLDALLVNLAERGDWVFAMYSPENFPTATHMVKLCEKRARKPFSEGVTPRMSKKEFDAAAMWVMERFLWLDSEMKSPEIMLETALQYGDSNQQLGIVLDPWNTLDHERGGRTETDYVSYVLTKVTELARSTNAHIWLVAHPAKMMKDRDGKRGIPTPYDIAGSAHWYNKADNIICVHRDQTDDKSQVVQVHIQKVRFKHCGRVGLRHLRYDYVTGRYFEVDEYAADDMVFMDPERGQTPPEPIVGERYDPEREAIRQEAA